MAHELCITEVKEPGEYGKPPIFVKDDFCYECHTRHVFEKCPECGSDIVISVGANYLKKFCESNTCKWEWLRVDDDE